ncbi:MAG: hypothetical protein M1825_000623 [Sarcosagium campestre]|nr:MAG: hypothetical protein M1825_000623 [Sarcosagium campestre]
MNLKPGPEMIKSLATLILDLPPSCIEFSPLHPDYLVVGTYYLDQHDTQNIADNSKGSQKTLQQRSGSLILCRIRDDEITVVQTLTHSSAILHLAFSPHDPSVLAVAGSRGDVAFYGLDVPSEPLLKRLSSHDTFPQSTLVLYCAWHPDHAKILGVTLSTGKLHILELVDDDYRHLKILLDGATDHELEAWVVEFASTSKGVEPHRNTVLSGGDDAVLRLATFNKIDIDAENGFDSLTLPPIRKLHTAGVTAIVSLAGSRDDETPDADPALIFTGSYDDNIRVISLSTRRVLAQASLGGGVWRLKTVSDVCRRGVDGSHRRRIVVLASCMHAGVRVVEMIESSRGWEISVLARFEEHKSMNYGSDFQPANKMGKDQRQPGQYLCASTSFYDRLLCLWRFIDDANGFS